MWSGLVNVLKIKYNIKDKLFISEKYKISRVITMRLFSQRKGFKSVKNRIQKDSMDSDLRNGLWNLLKLFYWDKVKASYLDSPQNEAIETLFTRLWFRHFKEPLDNLPKYWPKSYEIIRKRFFKFKWWEVYDFIEFVANNYPVEETNVGFMSLCNEVLKKELSAYRFVGGKITEMTSEEEISEIEESLKVSPDPVREHLKNSLNLLTDRNNPDYTNSIKESISAVEAICRLITKNKNAKLGQALNEIERKKQVTLHPALKSAFSKLYGYTSSADGIRHALKEESNLDFEDARFMLVSCSAFINYLMIKASKSGIKL